jgi:DNA-binding NtrC family response regulator/tetratricopeptide (TPR) repeat protein
VAIDLLAASSALNAGDLVAAALFLEGRLPAHELEGVLIKAEVELLRGYPEVAARLAADILERVKPTEGTFAKALYLNGVASLDLGNEQVALKQLERAATHAKVCGDLPLVARARLHILERSSDAGAPYHVSLPLSAEVLKAVRASGDKRVLTEAHISFGRLEARRGDIQVARRHLRHAERLLHEQPNRVLAASTYLTLANVVSIEGNIETARDLSIQSENDAREAGWEKGRAIAAANLAFYYICLGDLIEAERRVAQAEQSGFKAPGFRYALTNTRICLALAKRDYNEADNIWEAAERVEGVGAWYRLQGAHVRVRSLIHQRRFDEALALAKRSATEAARLNNELFSWIFNLSIADAQTSKGIDSFAPLELWEQANVSLGIIGARRRVLAKAFLAIDHDKARRQAQLSRRILAAAGIELEWIDETPLEEHSAEFERNEATIEDSSALLELAGHPHVLAREAYALLELTGAAEAMALVARGEAGDRPVALHGWTDAEAREAVATPGDRLVIQCGTHRDEAWEIVARLKPSLNDRCTAVAIKKLVDTAVTLDRYRREEKQRAALWPADTLETDGGLWVSEQMTELLSIARRIAPADVSVLLTGETGTGKEVLARAIHRASGRGAKPFIPFNCTAVPRDMLESQLFGYRKGAFTGAHNAFDGVIRAAAGGTLFLDEIAEIGPDLQPKLLRFLETHEVHGLGEPQPVKVDVRIIAATNGDLESLVAGGKFREDLFYRLNVVRLRVPPLRERREEIPVLADHYLRTFADQQQKGRLSLDDETLEYLVLFRWPGNVRQLVNEINRMVAYAEPDATITPAQLSPEVQASRRTLRVEPGHEPEIRVRLDQTLGDAVDAIERMMVLRALERARGNYENAARLLGISRKGLFLKRRRWGMQRQAAS